MYLSFELLDETYTGEITDEQRLQMAREEANSQVPHGIKAIFFDLHGVLVDITGWHKVAVQEAIMNHGYKVPIPRDIWKIPGGTIKQLDWLATQGWISRYDINSIYGRKQEYIGHFIQDRIKPIPKIIDVMSYASSAGFRLACVTNGQRHNAEKMLKAAGLHKYFEFIITRDDVRGKLKPHPFPYIQAMNRMGLTAKEALAVEDTDKGIMSAVDASCRTWRLKKQDDLNVRNLMRVLHSYRITI